MTEEQPATPKPRRRSNRGVKVTTSPAAIDRLQRDTEAVRLRRAGHTFDEIATACGYADKGRAHHAVTALLRAYPREDVELLRDITFDRYEQLIRGLWARAAGGDVWAVDRVSRLLDQQARLCGLNRPEKIQITPGETDLDAALRELEAQMRRRAAGTPIPQE